MKQARRHHSRVQDVLKSNDGREIKRMIQEKTKYILVLH